MKIVLDTTEIAQTKALLREMAARYGSAETEEFLDEAGVNAADLPRRVRQALSRFRLHEPEDGILVVSGFPIDQPKIGPTPGHWKTHHPANDIVEEDMLLVLLGSQLGEPIGWSTQQDGRVVHDILPIKGHEHEQLGSGSEELLTWHVEDAFHPYRGDYLGMMCLRNPDAVPTTFAPVSKVTLTPDELAVLASPHFTIRPDESHLPKNRGNGNDTHSAEETAVRERAYAKIEGMWNHPEKIPVIFGDPRAPYIRLDPYFMDPVENPAAQAALDEFTRQMDLAIEERVLEPGDFCFIDNFQAVHGRKAFTARFDGTDRWLRRINVVRDLRKSRESRLSAASRVLY
ncbi:MAG TPA: guanitoxin biosynthesis L-enduracididine beta-hydroxylase GntD [Longimicrobium sp.]|nr:guanitoxin biosynthesis L-enduracididine beta-hydroxylase GntD [Longimicrobium sp.]